MPDRLEQIIAAADKMEKALDDLIREAYNSVEYSDWPELQDCIEAANWAAEDYLKLKGQ